jgi:hypothetical protein
MKKNDIEIDVNLQNCIPKKKKGNPKEGGQEKDAK